MSVCALVSAKASPGATTTLLALAAAWPAGRPLLLVEADPDGGDLTARTGLPTEPGMATLAAAARRGLAPEAIAGHSQALPGGEVTVLVGPADAEQAVRGLALLAGPLGRVLPGRAGDVLVDGGRVRPGSPAWPLLVAADAVVLVVRPRLDELGHLPGLLRRADPRPSLILVGDRPYSPEDVSATLDVPVLGRLPEDPHTAAVLAGRRASAGSLDRSRLLRAARTLAEDLVHLRSASRHPAAGLPAQDPPTVGHGPTTPAAEGPGAAHMTPHAPTGQSAQSADGTGPPAPPAWTSHRPAGREGSR